MAVHEFIVSKVDNQEDWEYTSLKKQVLINSTTVLINSYQLKAGVQ
jgi:hypothetical protein